MCRKLSTITLFAILAALLAFSHAAGETTMNIPFQENFAGTSLGVDWQPRLTDNSTLSVKDGWLKIDAQDGSFAHVTRPLGVDCVTVTATIRWINALCIVWDEKNWCSVGLITPTPFGKFLTSVTTNGKTVERGGRGIDIYAPRQVRIQLGGNCIRFLYSDDGVKWIPMRTIERPAEFSGEPTLLAFGKYHAPGEDPFNPSKKPGTPQGNVLSAGISKLSIDRTPPKDLLLTSADRLAIKEDGLDRAGRAVLRRDEDPTYASVSKFFPAMKLAREVVGVPEHPLDIGVDRLGRFDVSPWTPPIGWIEIGEPGVPFGDEKIPITRRLLDGCIPVDTLTTMHGLVQLEMTVLGWSQDFSPDNDLYAYVRLRAVAKGKATLPSKIALVSGDGKRSSFDMSPSKDGAHEACIRFKYPNAAQGEAVTPGEFVGKVAQVCESWKKHLAEAERFEVPDKRVSEGYRAWLAYSMLNADKIDGRVEIHDGAGFYEEIFGYSMSLYTMAIDGYGLHDYAERCLDTQLHFQQPDGLYVQACGLPDHGGLLLALARHYKMTGDAEWLKRVAPQAIKACDWLLRQREAAPKDGICAGLIKFRPYNDYPVPVFNYLGNFYSVQGLQEISEAFDAIGMKAEAKRYAFEARRYREDVLASMKASAFKDGDMTILPIEPDTHRLLKLGQYRGGDYYGLVASCLLEMGFLSAEDEAAYWLTDMLEKRGGLIAGLCEFMCGIDHAYTYGYLMTQLDRDDIGKYLLGFWSMFAYGMTRDTYSPVEVTMLAAGQNHLTLPHTYSCTEQLRLLRNMLIREDGDTLRLGQAIPRDWLKPGKTVAVQSAPTTFGPTSYRISPKADGSIDVRIDPPTRTAPSSIKLRLRHPDQLSIASVEATPPMPVEFSGEDITLKGLTGPVELRVRFAK